MTNLGETRPLYDPDAYSDFIVQQLAGTFSRVDYIDRGSPNRHMQLGHWEEAQGTLFSLTMDLDILPTEERRKEVRRLSRERAEALLTHYQQTLTAAGDEKGRDLAAIDRFRLTAATIYDDRIFSPQERKNFRSRVTAVERTVDVEDLQRRYWPAIRKWLNRKI